MSVKKETPTPPSEFVASVDDLLLQILLRLPVKSLMRFTSVSKDWQSLITSSRFSTQYNPAPTPVLGMLYHGRKISSLEYIHLSSSSSSSSSLQRDHPTSPPFRELKFPDDPCLYWIQHSCSGLLLCCSSGVSDYNYYCRSDMSPIRRCYVYNPTINRFTKLPRPAVVKGVPRFVHGVTLAFDRAKSNPYKAVCVRGSEFAPNLCQVEIFSTESGGWRASGEPFDDKYGFRNGVYWNGSVHWVGHSRDEVLFFNVDQERFGNLALPAVPNGRGKRKVDYFGESYGRLHLILRNDGEIKMTVYEMRSRDGPRWFAKYQVDLTAVVAAFPKMVYAEVYTNRVLYDFTILLLVRDDENESAFLVMRILRKLVRFDLQCGTFEVINEFGDENWVRNLCRAFEYVESLCMFPFPTSS